MLSLALDTNICCRGALGTYVLGESDVIMRTLLCCRGALGTYVLGESDVIMRTLIYVVVVRWAPMCLESLTS